MLYHLLYGHQSSTSPKHWQLPLGARPWGSEFWGVAPLLIGVAAVWPVPGQTGGNSSPAHHWWLTMVPGTGIQLQPWEMWMFNDLNPLGLGTLPFPDSCQRSWDNQSNEFKIVVTSSVIFRLQDFHAAVVDRWPIFYSDPDSRHRKHTRGTGTGRRSFMIAFICRLYT